MGRTERVWRLATTVAVAIGVAFSLLLMSVAFGVDRAIRRRLSDPALQRFPHVDVHRIDAILAALTVVVAVAMLSETAVATFTLGVTAMRARREEIAIRRQSGVLRSRLVAEFLADVSRPCMVGGLVGEACGATACVMLRKWTVLPVRFTAVSLFSAFPVTVILAITATLGPAWRAANASPALLRRQH